VPLADAAAANALLSFAQKAKRRKTVVYIVGANPRVRSTLAANGVDADMARFEETELPRASESGSEFLPGPGDARPSAGTCSSRGDALICHQEIGFVDVARFLLFLFRRTRSPRAKKARKQSSQLWIKSNDQQEQRLGV